MGKTSGKDGKEQEAEDAAVLEAVRAKIDLIELLDAINDDEGSADLLIARGKAIRSAQKWLALSVYAAVITLPSYILLSHFIPPDQIDPCFAALGTLQAICIGINLASFIFAGGFNQDRYRWMSAARANDTVKNCEKALTRNHKKSRAAIEQAIGDGIRDYINAVTQNQGNANTASQSPIESRSTASSQSPSTDNTNIVSTPLSTSESIYDLRLNIRKRLVGAIKESRGSSILNLSVGIILIIAIAIGHTHVLDLINIQFSHILKEKNGPFDVVQLFINVSASAFAFFFLWTYRSHSNDAKFFRNELTSIDMKLLGVLQAKEAAEASSGNRETHRRYMQILEDLARTERHLLLNFGQKSVYDEVAKTERLFWRMGLRREINKP